MAEVILSHPPLVEAILEIKWKLKQQSQGLAIDPYYKILVGRLYDKLISDYPFHEALPTASMPDEMLAYVVQHRFRKAENDWPLVQIGPGIITLNQTKNYKWTDFKPLGEKLITTLFETYPSTELSISSLIFRYVDAIPFNFIDNDILAFISTNLKTHFEFPKELFEKMTLHKFPVALNTLFVYPVASPAGSLTVRFASGKNQDTDSLIWETIYETTDPNLPVMPTKFSDWFNSAHMIIHDIFFTLIKGPLEERFR